MDQQHSGYKRALYLAIICLCAGLLFACANLCPLGEKQYDPEQMAQLDTLTHKLLTLTFGEYAAEESSPSLLSEKQIKDLARSDRSEYNELHLLDQYDIVIHIKQGKEFAAVVWNPKDNHRILIQALRCFGKQVANEAEMSSWKQTIYDKTHAYSKGGVCR